MRSVSKTLIDQIYKPSVKQLKNWKIQTCNSKSYFTVPSRSHPTTTAAPPMTLPGTSPRAQHTLCIPGLQAAHHLSPERRARAPRYGFPITSLTEAFRERRTAAFGTNGREPLCSAPAPPGRPYLGTSAGPRPCRGPCPAVKITEAQGRNGAAPHSPAAPRPAPSLPRPCSLRGPW